MTTPAPETRTVNRFKVACDGGPGLGHPRVWLQIPREQGWVECPYCDARYVYQADAPDAATRRSDAAGTHAP